MNNATMTQRWQAAAKQGLCLLLCLLMFVTLLPVKAYAAAKVDRTQALARIAQLQKELERQVTGAQNVQTRMSSKQAGLKRLFL